VREQDVHRAEIALAGGEVSQPDCARRRTARSRRRSAYVRHAPIAG
jgi:hypothetical protein